MQRCETGSLARLKLTLLGYKISGGNNWKWEVFVGNLNLFSVEIDLEGHISILSESRASGLHYIISFTKKVYQTY